MDKIEFTGERYIPGEGSLDINIEHNIRYSFATQFVSGKNVLDIASGEGYGSNILAKTAKNVVGIDISNEAVAFAKSKYIKDNLEFMQGSIAKIPLPDKSIDIIISFETIEHVGEELQNAFMIEAKRVLKSDGVLIMSTPNRPIYTELFNEKNEFHIKEFDRKEYLDFINRYFKNNMLIAQSNEMVSFLVSDEFQENANITNKFNIDNAKYFISISSDININKEIKSQTYVWEQTKYTDKLLRILELQDSVEELSAWGISLDKELNEKTSYINSLKTQLDSNKVELDNTKTQLDNNKVELDNNKIQLDNNKVELDNIYSSRTWRYLGYIWRIRDKIIPKGSKRRLIIKISIKAIKNPILLAKKLTPSKIKKSLSVIKREGIEGVITRVDDIIVNTLVQDIKLNLLPQVSDINKADKIIFNKQDKPTVSIIIPVYNQVEYTYNCLKSILNNTRDISYEIIIANDCSTDATLKLADICENIKIISNETNLRFLKNCNNAAKYATGEYILFLNNDTQVMENWLKPLVDVITLDDSIGMVGSKLIYPDGRLQEAGGIIWSDGSGWNYGRLSNPEDPEFNYIKEADYISGAAIMIRNTLWNEIGGFDEYFAPAYYEDTDLAFTIRNMGKKVVFVPKSVVVHFEGVSNGTDTSLGQKSYQVINSNKFMEKWKDTLSKNHFPNGENVFLARDRSKDKKTILVIDHYVPTHDKDAGSKTIYQYLKLFIQMGYNVKFIGDNFAKLQPYTDDLQNLGVEVLYGSYYMSHWKDYLKENGKYIDFVFINRPHIAIKYIDFIKTNIRAKVIYNVCDLHFIREQRQYELTGDLTILESAKKWEKLELEVMSKVDFALTLSVDEQNIINKHFPKKGVIVPIFIFENFNDENINFNAKKDLLFVGGFNHRPNIDGINWFLDNIWNKVSHLGCKLYIAGSNPPKSLKDRACDNIIITGFISDEHLDDLYKKCSIAIIPLTYGAGVKGKTIEAMHKNIAIVSTKTGIEGLLNIETYIEDSTDIDIFAQNIISLYNNPEKQKQQTQKFNEFLKYNFSFDSAAKTFKKIFGE